VNDLEFIAHWRKIIDAQGDGSTHWDDCHLSHGYCAIVHLCNRVEALAAHKEGL